jgi:hypothetical protein
VVLMVVVVVVVVVAVVAVVVVVVVVMMMMMMMQPRVDSYGHRKASVQRFALSHCTTRSPRSLVTS